MRRWTLSILLLVTWTGRPAAQDAADYRVHEWGTFTAIAGRNGAWLEWRPLVGEDDLPDFVHDLGGGQRGARTIERNTEGPVLKKERRATIRMETPVLYFHTERPLDVDVRVRFPGGEVTEWFPYARSVGRGIDWGRVRVQPGLSPKLPREQAESHYYPARRTEAAPISVDTPRGVEREKFLFYRGVASFSLPVRVLLQGDDVRCKSLLPRETIRYVLFERRGGRIAYGVYALGGPKNDLPITRPLRGDPIWWPGLDHVGGLEKLLVGAGLTPKEAAAMLATWADTWFGDGLRAFFLLPQSFTDEVLPLELHPAPKQTVRVMVARVEILTPRMEQEIERFVAMLGDPSAEIRERATVGLRQHGRFAEPVLERLLAQATTREMKERVARLLDR